MTNVAEQEIETGIDDDLANALKRYFLKKGVGVKATRGRKLGVIVDTDLANAIENWQQAQAEFERLRAIADSLKTSDEAAECLASTAHRRAQCDVDDIVAVSTKWFAKWRDRLDAHNGIGVVYGSTVFPPPYLSDGQVFEVKRLVRSATPEPAAAPRNGHVNRTTAAPAYQCAADVPTVDTDLANASHRDIWKMIIRRAAAARLDARAWNQKVTALVPDETNRANFKTWAAIDSTVGTEECEAEEWLTGCILAYHGLIKDAGDIHELPPDWKPVVLTLDSVTYIVRGSGDFVDDARGRPVLEVTTAGSVAMLATA